MNAETFCDPQTDRVFVLIKLSDDGLVTLAVEVDRLWQQLPEEPEKRVGQVLEFLQSVYQEIGRRAVMTSLASEMDAAKPLGREAAVEATYPPMRIEDTDAVKQARLLTAEQAEQQRRSA